VCKKCVTINAIPRFGSLNFLLNCKFNEITFKYPIGFGRFVGNLETGLNVRKDFFRMLSIIKLCHVSQKFFGG